MSAAFSGPSENLGNELYGGIMTYLDFINNKGGVNGRKVVIRKYDDGYNPIPALRNTLKLMNEDNVLALFSYVGTPTVIRVLPLLKLNNSDHFYLFFPFTGAQPQREAPYKDFVFNLRPSYRDETAGLVENFIEIGKRKIAVFYQADAYGRSGWDGVRRALNKNGLELSVEATYSRGSEYGDSYKAQIDIIKQASPDAVIAVGSYAACAGFIRDARDAGWNIPVANLSFVGSESLLELLLEESKTGGKDYTVNLINSEVVPNYDDLSIPAVKEYRTLSGIYNKSSNDINSHGLSFVGLEGFLNAKLLVHILAVMDGKIERKRLKSITESIQDYDIGLPDKISLSADKHQALKRVYYNTVKEGTWVSINNFESLK
ncbi:MAG: ABC transporter substrate-binding protein [Candidatus Dadabacteria bacterium]|nr:ABC transporter substrate-binding protein [Candidatus Dadabacteria bacterium]